MSASPLVTRALVDVQEGRRHDAAELAPVVYDELREHAARALARERANHTLQPTALVHEAFLALADGTQVDWRGRTHFFAVAARCMRRLLVDHARRHNAARHGGGRVQALIDEHDVPALGRPIDALEFDEVLSRLTTRAPQGAQVVELRFFGGLTEPETAMALGISERTVRREWKTARAWLRAELAEDG